MFAWRGSHSSGSIITNRLSAFDKTFFHIPDNRKVVIRNTPNENERLKCSVEILWLEPITPQMNRW